MVVYIMDVVYIRDCFALINLGQEVQKFFGFFRFFLQTYSVVGLYLKVFFFQIYH